jgi:hypothetical protein
MALMVVWLFGRLQMFDTAAQQPAAVPSLSLRRKIKASESPPYVIEWMMPASYRRRFRFWLVKEHFSKVII